MSKKETQGTGQEPEKTVTRYDRKMQRRKEQKEKAIREEQVSRIMGIVLLVALACVVASFPIRNYLTVNGTYATVNGEKISRVEFDYNYYVARSTYLNQYGAYLSYFGVDTSKEVDTQMYSDKLTWGDYFKQLAVENIARNRGLRKAAAEEGFTYDTTEDYKLFQEDLKKAASGAGKTAKEYLKDVYGPYATLARVKPCLESSFFASAYSEAVAEKLTPSQEEIQAYYEKNQASYDSVDYYKQEVDAELPTEPTELADPVEPAEGEEASSAEDGSGEEEAYQPSEAEIEAAMKEAKAEADKLEKTLLKDSEVIQNTKKSAITSLISDWLFDEGRKQGDTTVIEDATNHRYYVVGFESRYLDQTPSVDLRVTMTAEDNGQAILDEWKAGAATEDSFAELCDKYNDATVTDVKGGLLEGVLPSDVPTELADWMKDSARAAGDTAVISPDSDEYTYVLYYKGTNDAEWIQRIRSTLRNENVSVYMGAFTENVDVQDPKGNLRYLKVRAEEEAAAQESSAQESAAQESNAQESDTQTSQEEGNDSEASDNSSQAQDG